MNTLFWPENDINRIKQRLATCKKVNHELNYIVVKNGIIKSSIAIDELPYGAVTNEIGEYIEYSASRIDFYKEHECKELNIEGLRKVNKKAIFLGVFLNQTGHFTLESLSRLWVIEKIKNWQQYDLIYTTSEWGYGKWFQEFLELAGVKNAICVNETTQYDEIIVPEPSSGIFPDFYTQEYLDTLSKLSKNIKPAKYQKIYFSRTQLKDNLIGEEEIEDIFRKNKYTIMYPEKMTIKEKIAVVKGCKEFAAVSGSTPLWILFAGDNLQQVYILERFQLFHSNISFAEKILKANFNYVMANYSFLPSMYGPGPCLMGKTKYLYEFFKKYKFRNIKHDSSKLNKNIIKYLLKWGELYKDQKYVQGLYKDDYLLQDDIIVYINKLINNSFARSIGDNELSKLQYYRILLLSLITFGNKKQHYKNKLLYYQNLKGE